MCFERRYPKQNTVIRLKSNILASANFFAPPQIFGWLRHWALGWNFLTNCVDAVLIKDEDCLCLDQRLTRKLQLKVEVNLCVAHDFVHETLQSTQTIILPDGNDDFGSDHDSGDDYLTSGISSFPGEDRCSLLKKRLSLSTGTTISHWHEGTIIMYSRPRLLKPRMINPRDGIFSIDKTTLCKSSILFNFLSFDRRTARNYARV